MSRSWFLFAVIAATCAACGSSTGPTGTGGGTSTGSGGKGSSTSSSSSSTSSSSTSSSSSSSGATSCPDPSNPLFGSCLTTFLAGCWMPDTSGTCTNANGTTTWADGSKYVTTGAMPGLYGPGDTTPCISMVISGSSITATKGTQTIEYAGGATTSTITCPDGSMITATDAQVTAFNTCEGLNCP
jgi:hypothetical protein